MSNDLTILPVDDADLDEWLDMGLALWPDNDREELRSSFEELLRTEKEQPFIRRDVEGFAVAFINLSTRTDSVEGTEGLPVGYIEGIFVTPEFRGRGVGRALVRFAEQWTKQKGYRQLASDADLHKVDSHHFHTAVGFCEANRIVAFVMTSTSGPGDVGLRFRRHRTRSPRSVHRPSAPYLNSHARCGPVQAR